MFVVNFLFKAILTLLITTFLVFLLMNLLSGDMASYMSGTTQNYDKFNKLYNTNESFFGDYLDWLLSIITGNIATSKSMNVLTSEIIFERMVVTTKIAILSFLISIFFGVCLGLLMVIKKNNTYSFIANLFLSLSPVTFGILLIYLFSIKINLFNIGDDSSFIGILMPSLVLAMTIGSITARYVYSGLLNIKEKEFIHFSCIKGNSMGFSIIKYGLPHISSTIFAIASLQINYLISGTIVIEKVFLLPGMGSLLFNAIIMRDVYVSCTIVAMLLILMIFINLFFDLANYAINPLAKRETKI